MIFTIDKENFNPLHWISCSAYCFIYYQHSSNKKHYCFGSDQFSIIFACMH